MSSRDEQRKPLPQGRLQSQWDVGEIGLGRRSGCSKWGEGAVRRLPGRVLSATCHMRQIGYPSSTAPVQLRFCNQTVGRQPHRGPTRGAHQAPDQPHLPTRSVQDPHSLWTGTAPPSPQPRSIGTKNVPSRPTRQAPLPSPAAFGIQGGLPVWAEDSPVRLGDEVLWPVSGHGGRVPGVGGQLWRCPLRVRVVGLDEGDVAQQGSVGRAENLLAHLLWIVRRHLQVRDERGAGSSRAHCFLALTPTPTPAPVPLCHCGDIEGTVLGCQKHRARLLQHAWQDTGFI